MNDILLLLKPGILALANKLKGKGGKSRNVKALILFVIGICFWVGLFWISRKVLLYFSSIEQIGTLISYKLLSMTVSISFFLLLVSAIITSISRFYLSKDLIMVHTMPAKPVNILLSRWIVSLFDSSWMVLLYIFPALLAYPVVFETGPVPFFIMAVSFCSLAVTASAIASIGVMLLVTLVPATTLKSIFAFFGLALFIALYIGFRMLKPEQLVDPESFNSVLAYISALKTPSSPLFPGTWVFEAIQSSLEGNLGPSLFHISLSVSFSALLILVLAVAGDLLYFRGVTASIEEKGKNAGHLRRKKETWRNTGAPGHAIRVKEIRYFFRDQTQWGQLFLVAALITIYIYNFTVLPFDKSPIGEFYLQNLLSFLNMGLALFVLTSVAARFSYPAVSMEAESFWMIRSAPVSMMKFLLIKFFVHYIPLLILTEILVVITNILLQVTDFMMMLSVVTTFVLVPSIVALAIGIGGIYADFNLENPLKSVTGFGGIMYMILCAAITGGVILLEAGPVYTIFMAEIRGRALADYEIIWSAIAFSLVPVIAISALVIPLRLAARHLSSKTGS